MKIKYIPKPVDVTAIELPAELEALVERIAENAHDVWALNRMNEGWTYGPQRDDAQKHHPCLVSYAELPDSEKAYDRNMAMSSIKLIKALGFEIKIAKEK